MGERGEPDCTHSVTSKGKEGGDEGPNPSISKHTIRHGRHGVLTNTEPVIFQRIPLDKRFD